MKKEYPRKRRHFLLGLFCTVGILMAATTSQAAAKAPSCTKTQTVYCAGYMDSEGKFNGYSFSNPTRYIFIKNLAKDAEITNLKSSNSSVRPMLFPGYKYIGFNGVMVEWAQGDRSDFKLNSKVKLSFTVRQNGKKYKLSTIVTFKKQKTPFQQLKFDKLDLAKKVAGYSIYSGVKTKGNRVKISVKPVRDVTVDKIEVYYTDGSGFRVIKNGTCVPTKGLDRAIIYYSSKKPANYQKPHQWPLSMWSDPLQDTMQIIFAQS